MAYHPTPSYCQPCLNWYAQPWLLPHYITESYLKPSVTSLPVISFIDLIELCWYSQRRSRTDVLCTGCVRCDVSSDRIALFTLCVMHHDSAKRHILGVTHPRRWAMTPKFELGGDFCAMHLSPSFIILCLLVLKLLCWHTNPQKTDAAENIQRSSLCCDVG